MLATPVIYQMQVRGVNADLALPEGDGPRHPVVNGDVRRDDPEPVTPAAEQINTGAQTARVGRLLDLVSVEVHRDVEQRAL